MKRKWKGSYACYVILFVFYYYCMAAFGSVLSVYLTGIGIGIADMSLIVSAASLFGFVMIPVIGYLADRTGAPRQIAGILMIGIGIFAVLFSFSRKVAILFLLNGLAMSCISAAQPILERMAGAAKYRYGILRVWGTVGYAVGAQAAGLILQYSTPLVLFGSVFAAGCIAAVGITGAEDPVEKADSRNKSVRYQSELSEKKENQTNKRKSDLADSKNKWNSAALISFIKNSQYLLYLLIALLFWGCSGANMTYIPVLLTDLGIHTGTVGTILFFSTLIEIPIIVYSNVFMDRFSGRVLLWIACTLTLAEFVVFGTSRSVPLVVGIVILFKAIATTMFIMITLKVVRSIVPAELTTTGLALINTFNSVGTILLQNMGGRIVEKTSLPFFYRVMACIVLGIMILTFFLRPGKEEKVFG